MTSIARSFRWRLSIRAAITIVTLVCLWLAFEVQQQRYVVRANVQFFPWRSEYFPQGIEKGASKMKWSVFSIGSRI
jgi:hypothetical protein